MLYISVTPVFTTILQDLVQLATDRQLAYPGHSVIFRNLSVAKFLSGYSLYVYSIDIEA
jgi:hypothetical protein